MIADQSERSQALDPSRSFIVQAPAGSGKTALLVQRYLKLLSLVEKPESVVAMTFTRKAAAELNERIHEALLAADKNSSMESEHDSQTRDLAVAVLRQDRRQGWNLLLDHHRLQIQTIDSLCAMLTCQMPVVSGFGGSARVVEDASSFYRLAARDTLRNLAEGSPENQSLLSRLGIYFDSDFVSLEDQIVGMLAQRDQWRFAGGDNDPQVGDFCELLTAAEQALAEVFRQYSTVDFTAITRSAIQVLGAPEQPSDLLFGLDYRIQHLLVDEFQDTSFAQYELIDALTAQWSDGDGHTLFLVGDPMQSIYGFRGAEVSLFLKSWNDESLKSVRLHPISLRTNFRCTPEILTWVRRQFEPIMSGDLDGGVQFRLSETARPVGGILPGLTALVDDSGDEEEAATVAKLAKSARKRGSVAILVRSRNHLESILPALREQGLPYEAVDIDKLADQQHVDDLISLTRAILHTGDRVSWLSCLRAPWCGLTVSDLAALAENERERTVVDLLLDPDKIAALSVEGRWRAVRCGEILTAALSKVGRVSLRTLLEDVWLLLGGPAILQEPQRVDDVRNYFDLIEELEDGGILRDLTLLNQRLDCLFAKPSKGDNYIQVMTVHQAKGLEFDTVIIPQLAGGSRSSDRDLLIWDEFVDADGNGILNVAAQPRKGEKDDRYETIRQAHNAKEEHELKRLFYVGCTRAKNELYLLGNTKAKKEGVHTPRSNTFLRLIWQNVEAEFMSVLRRSPVQRSLFAEEKQARKTILRRVEADWQLPSFSRSVEWQPAFRETTASARKVTYEWVSDTGRHVGTVAHDILKRFAEAGASDSALASVVQSELLRLGVPKPEEAAGSERVLRAVRNTLSSERGQWILSPHSESRSEWPVGGIVGSQIVSGAIDRIFRAEDGRLWIIDFKTSEHEGGRTKKFLDEEQRRYKPQLESYATLVARLEKGPISLGLYFPLLDAWREWEFEEAAVLAAQ